MSERYNKQTSQELQALPVKHAHSDMSPEEMRILAGTIFGQPIEEMAIIARSEKGNLCLTGSDIGYIPNMLEAGLEVFEKAFKRGEQR